MQRYNNCLNIQKVHNEFFNRKLKIEFNENTSEEFSFRSKIIDILSLYGVLSFLDPINLAVLNRSKSTSFRHTKE